MRRTEHDVNSVGSGLQNRRHRIDHDFDTLVRREQSEGQDDRLVPESERGLGRVGFDKRELRDAVRDDFDLLVSHVINGAQQFPTFFSHHDDLGRRLDDACDDIALSLCRLGQDRMQGCHDRYGQARQERHDLTSGFAAENAEFMLQRNGLEAAAVQISGRTDIIILPVVVDLQAHGGRIIIDLAVIGHRDDDGFQIAPGRRNGALQVGGESRNAAAAGKRIPDECDTIYGSQFGVSDCLSAAVSKGVGTRALGKACGTRLALAALRSINAAGFAFGPG
ncbi:hypothetical protein ACVWYI_006614 [Bradyrhizobium sp. LB13.1]